MKKFLNVLTSILIFLLIWGFSAVVIGSTLLPTPQIVINAIYILFIDGIIIGHIFASLTRVIIGFSLALLVAIILGIAAGIFPHIDRLFKPILEILRPIPPIAWIPLSILWFGIGNISASFIIFMASFFPIFTSFYFGITSVPRIYERVSKNYNLSSSQRLYHIKIPFSLPYLLNGCKLGIGIAWMALIGAEMISSNRGLGYFIEVNRLLLRIEYVIATMIIIGLIGYSLNLILSFIERKILFWRENNE